jgi:hypothetical protein
MATAGCMHVGGRRTSAGVDRARVLRESNAAAAKLSVQSFHYVS